MPSDHQGVLFRAAENPILYLKTPKVYRSDRRAQLDALSALNQSHYQDFADRKCYPESNSTRWLTGCGIHS